MSDDKIIPFRLDVDELHIAVMRMLEKYGISNFVMAVECDGEYRHLFHAEEDTKVVNYLAMIGALDRVKERYSNYFLGLEDETDDD